MAMQSLLLEMEQVAWLLERYIAIVLNCNVTGNDGKMAVENKSLGCRSRASLIKSVTLCHNVLGEHEKGENKIHNIFYHH